ncbi:alkyl/aryl-sulfatase [Roseateles sp. BYS78W]|uniref:Alkyl/aryl-sulfatase n=1 Tax=Pelomonas candidula TaxID=3299025 RepID=A0ABW7HH93_9BURK
MRLLATALLALAAFTTPSAHADDPAPAEAKRGFIARPSGQIKAADGNVVWDFADYTFIDGDAPATVNPSLWRHAKLNNEIGLFKVTEGPAGGIWQLRGFDLANLTLVDGKTGWIVIDTLSSRETAAAAMAFARQYLGDKPVSAVVFTHSHADHFGGALGVISAEDVKARQVPVIAPAGFMEEATSENLLVGTAMGRRATWMYGNLLPRSATGSVDTGLGKALALGRLGILAPTQLIEGEGQELVVDGRRLVFHNVPGSEAPAEFVIELPEFKAFCGAELLSHNLHNLLTPRGAKVRDALRWAGYLDTAQSWAANADVVFNSHQWPVWGTARIKQFISAQADVYRFIHDQTVRGINQGLNADEIAERMQLPKALQEDFDVRGYYGALKFNVRAVYQFYLGFFDGHPSHLDPLPPVDMARRYVQLAGGPDKIVAAAQAAFDAGDHRWAAELLRHAVLADAGNQPARELLARTFEQLAWKAESAPQRNFYLSGALELRGASTPRAGGLAALGDLLQYVPIERFFERSAASLDPAKAEGVNLKINLVFTDLGDTYVLTVANSVLRYRKGAADAGANATLTLPKAVYLRLLSGQLSAREALTSGDVQLGGNPLALSRFFGLFQGASGNFPIVTR